MKTRKCDACGRDMDLHETSTITPVEFYVPRHDGETPAFKFLMDQPSLTWQFNTTDKDVCRECIGMALGAALSIRYARPTPPPAKR